MAEIETSESSFTDPAPSFTDPLSFLKAFTAARIAIGHTGSSIPVKASLEFKLAHAHARDAVYSAMDVDMLADRLAQFNLPVLSLNTKAESRASYLQRPDLGRQLDQRAQEIVENQVSGAEVSIVIADGLSAFAIHENIVGLLELLIPKLLATNLRLAPISLVQQGRVAVGDEIGESLNAGLSLVFIGERPGLSAADSMGAYLTYHPQSGLTDDSRNCVSNIRAGGLTADLAVTKIFYLIQEAFKRKLSGVLLKDNAGLL